jgi:hypothetical protein
MLDSGITYPPYVDTGVNAKDSIFDNTTYSVTLSVRLHQSNVSYKPYHVVGTDVFDKMILIDVLRYFKTKQ